MSNQIWVSPHNENWKVHSFPQGLVLQYFILKKDAVSCGIEVAKQHKAELIIQRKDGTIEERRSYGKDPYPPKG